MRLPSILIVGVMPTLALAEPTCSRVTFSVQAAANNSAFSNLSCKGNSKQLIDAVDSVLSGNSTITQHSDLPVSGSFDISAIYCEPSPTFNGTKNANTLQFLVHGMTYNATLWSGLGVSDHYSWVSHAARRGYPTLAIDRLGHGDSHRPDPVSLVQFGLQTEILHQLLSKLRITSGACELGRSFNKIVYVGHSYGSLLGNAIARIYPEDADAIVLTGYSANVPQFVPVILNDFNSASQTSNLYSSLPPGYLRATNETGRTEAFYGNPGTFDPALAYYDFSSADTVTVGEVLTQQGGFIPAGYEGPVLIVTGAQDVNFCSKKFGTCEDSLRSTNALFPNATSFDYHVIQDSGHCLTLNYEAPKTFRVALDWMDSL